MPGPYTTSGYKTNDIWNEASIIHPLNSLPLFYSILVPLPYTRSFSSRHDFTKNISRSFTSSQIGVLVSPYPSSERLLEERWVPSRDDFPFHQV